MKNGIFIIVLFTSLAFAQMPEPDAIAKLNDSIKQLDMEINRLLKIIETQKKEIEFLRKLCIDAGINVTPAPAGIGESVRGVYLGESLEDLKTRRRVSKSNYTFADKEYPGEVWSVENYDPNISSLLAYAFNDQIYEVDVDFADANAAMCESLKTQLGQKYKTVYGNTFETVIDDVNIGIELNCGGSNNKITLSYIHVPLLREIYAELDKRKAQELDKQQANKPKEKHSRKKNRAAK